MEEHRRVLVVDEDVYLQVLLSMALPAFDVSFASRKQEGYDLAVADHPHVVVIDEHLPDGDGVELAQELRRRGARIPIVMVSSAHDEGRRVDVLRAGADEYLVKPPDPIELRARIERLLSLEPAARRARRDQLQQRLRAGERGDLDPPLGATPAPRRRRGLSRILSRRGPAR